MHDISFKATLIIFFVSILYTEDYRIYLLGIPIVEVSMESSTNSLDFSTQTVGFFHSIWPIDNYYKTEYDSISFGIRKYTKSIHQGNYKGKLDCDYDPASSNLNYADQSVAVVDSIQNIFTLLARVSYQSYKDIDTQWFPMNHEGIPNRARFLWIGTETVKVSGVEVLCDHYRLDIEQTKEDSIHISPYDYFTDHVASTDALRQLWVEKMGERRIIQASVTVYGITLTAEIQDE